jgi:UrcA family protein
MLHYFGASQGSRKLRTSGGEIMTIAHKLLGAAVSVLSLACAAAYADSRPYAETTLRIGSHSELVRFNDLNLDQARDVARLHSRITLAADRVCGPRSFAGYYNKTADYEICYNDAIARAVAHIDRPSVTAYFQQRSSDLALRKLTAQQ